MNEIKIISINVDGREYSAKWSVWAKRQFMKGWIELEEKKDAMGEMAYSMGLMQVAEDATQGMLVRAGMPLEIFDDLDGDEITELSSKVMTWYMASMNRITKAFGNDELKNEAETTEEAITTP